MRLIEVRDKATAKKFLEVNVKINRNTPDYIQPLDKDIEQVFDPKKNKAFRHGKVIRWVLVDDKGESQGRIAAFTNKQYKNKGDQVMPGGMGFFDCINDQAAANLLLNQAKEWLANEGMTAMDGPINFGERDRWWGLVVKGFQPPLYCMNYNPPYYQQLLETYGFKPFFEQICFGMNPKERMPEKIWSRNALISEDPAFRVRTISKSELPKFAGDFATVYNAAWAGHGGLKQLKKEQVEVMFRQMKPVMDERIIWFAYHRDQAVGIFVNLPDLNQWFKYLHGKFTLFHKLKFLWVKSTKPCTKFTGLVFGIVPQYQGMGVDAYLIGEAGKDVMQDSFPYTEYEMQWIGDFNPKMINVAQSLGDVYESRKLVTYRYQFDREMEYRRHPMV